MANIGLYITLEPRGGHPVTVAKVADRRLLIAAATAAIAEAEAQVRALAGEDELLGHLQHAEAARLRHALELLVPEVRGAGTAGAVM